MNIQRLLFLLILCLGALCSCGGDDEPTQADTMASVDITYTYTISEDMLKYFNFTADYINASGAKVSQQMTEPTLKITTSADKFPASRPLKFTVTRKDVATPTVAPAWSYSMSIIVTKRYTPSGNVENSSHTDGGSYTPKPDKFDEWADRYIKQMATGYPVTINADGRVNF